MPLLSREDQILDLLNQMTAPELARFTERLKDYWGIGPINPIPCGSVPLDATPDGVVTLVGRPA